MYEMVVINLQGKKYLLNYNTQAITVDDVVEMLRQIDLDDEDGMEDLKEALMLDYDSCLEDYVEYKY